MQLTPDLLLRAYAIGIFPMAESRSETELHWIDPDRRGVLPLERVHVPRRLRRRIRRGEFTVRCDSAFREVIEGCAARTKSRPDTWINPVIQRLYCELHEAGFAHSVECWQGGRLVGGLYGVTLGAAFFGESMFSCVTDASKVALIHLVIRLRKGDFRLLDTQFNTPHLSQFGVIEIPREDYRRRLARAITTPAEFPAALSEEEIAAFLNEVSDRSLSGSRDA